MALQALSEPYQTTNANGTRWETIAGACENYPGTKPNGKSSRVFDIRRHSRLWLLDNFCVDGRVIWLMADVACRIVPDSGWAAQHFQ
jgi:hypothetical protein